MFKDKSKAYLSIVLLGWTTAVSAAFADDAKWEEYNSAGAEAFQMARFGPAEKYFKLAVQEAEKFGDKDSRLASSLTNLGVLYNSRGMTAKAEPLFVKAVEVKENALGAENPEVIAAIGKLCQFYLRGGNHTKADPLCDKVLSYADNAVKEKQQLSSSFAKLSTYYQKHSEFEQAEILVKQAQNMTEKSAANNHLELATLLDALAGSFAGTNRNQLAEQLYQHSLALREQALPPTHIALASSYENLGKLYMAESKNAQAEPLLLKSVEISRSVLGDAKQETLSRTETLAQCYIKLGKTQDAEKLYSHILQVFGKGSGSVASTEVALSNLLSRQGRYKEAANLLSEAVKTTEKLNGPQHASLSPILDNYADALDHSNRHSEAEKAKARAKAIRG